ncbi:MAG: Peptidase, M23/M37 family [Rhodobacteraceae bacterium HLUCCA12]|nr:MAG: Peptidase, M23/M37 family [Rhodobacteraceae bacterium HLUCCA12]
MRDGPLRHWTDRSNAVLERYLPEKRLFLRSENSTRFVRLRPLSQAMILGGTTLLVVWSIFASSIVFMEAIGSTDLREQTRREQIYLEHRLTELAAERDRSAAEAHAAHERYAEAMDRVASMQGALLSSEQRLAELETGVETLQGSLRERIRERDTARSQLAEVEREDTNEELIRTTARLGEVEQTLDFVMRALRDTADEREAVLSLADSARQQAEHLALEYRLMEDRNNRIFSQLEQAVEVSVMPLERMFREAGIEPDQLLNQVRAGYQDERTASLMPVSVSTMGTMDTDSDEARTNAVLSALEEINLYRIAAERTPFALPVRAAVRQTSGFGMRRHPITGRNAMHEGIDWAGPQGTAIHATGEGTVTHAGWRGGYGNMVIVRHEFGIETYYAHLHTINVSEGQRVSRGDRIGGMGTTGRSTGVHLHYEIRANGRPINPMTYIRAAQNVF